MRPSALLVIVTVAAGCGTPKLKGAGGGVELVPAPPAGDVAAVVRDELARASRDGKQLLVYDGATWCEPCRRFHQAAEEHKLDREFPTLRLLVFDDDRDGRRLAVAGYVGKYIPLFVRPGPDGRSSGRQVEGSVKGDGAVDQIVPRLRALLSP